MPALPRLPSLSAIVFVVLLVLHGHAAQASDTGANGLPPWTLQLANEDFYLKPPAETLAKAYGASVAIHGGTLVVGAPEEVVPAGGSAFHYRGAVYVYTWGGTGWVLQQWIRAPYERKDDFGRAVSLDGDVLVVGAPEDSSDGADPASNTMENSGAVYVFARSGSTWTRQAYLKASNLGEDDLFGGAVALRGNTLVVGASGEDGSPGNPADDSRTDSGAAYVFTRSGDTWTQRAYLKATNADAGDLFGFSVALDGNAVAVGAQREGGNGSSPGDNSASQSGAAYVFIGSGAAWTQQAYLKASNVGANDLFGTSIALQGNRVVVGAFGEDSDGADPANNLANGAGAAYVFERAGTQWTERALLKAFNPKTLDYFGYRVAIDSGVIVVGAFQENSDGATPYDPSLIKSGAAYVFHPSGDTWAEVTYLKASNADRFDEFGSGVAVHRGNILVGARSEASATDDPEDDSAQFRGAAYVFTGMLPDPIFRGSFD